MDVLSGGRLTYGVGRGYQSVEYDAFGAPLDEARERTDEAIEILRKLWTQPRASHKGRFFAFDEVRLQPKPVQKPHPPMIYASISPQSVAHYARQGVPFMVGLCRGLPVMTTGRRNTATGGQDGRSPRQGG